MLLQTESLDWLDKLCDQGVLGWLCWGWFSLCHIVQQDPNSDPKQHSSDKTSSKTSQINKREQHDLRVSLTLLPIQASEVKKTNPLVITKNFGNPPRMRKVPLCIYQQLGLGQRVLIKASEYTPKLMCSNTLNAKLIWTVTKPNQEILLLVHKISNDDVLHVQVSTWRLVRAWLQNQVHFYGGWSWLKGDTFCLLHQIQLWVVELQS